MPRFLFGSGEGGVGSRRGAVLIVVLGILVILALMATAFAVIQTQERNVSRNYVDGVRARLVAQSGIEEGVERLQQSLGTGMSALAAQVGKDPAFAWEVDENPLNADKTLRKIKVNGQPTALTGAMSNGTYGDHGDFYVLKVSDLQGRIHLNQGVGEPGVTDTNGDGLVNANDSSGSQNLRRILNNLGANSTVGVPSLGDKILKKRPLSGFQAVEEIEPILGTADYKKASPFLTAKAWIDRDVANPVPLSSSVLSEYPVQYYRGTDIHRYGRNRNAKGNQISTALRFSPPGGNGTENAVFGADELNPQWIQVAERAPVNMNTAPREVVIALLDGLRGFFMLERRGDNLPSWQTVYQWLNRKHTLDPSGSDPGAIGYLYQTVPIVGPGSGTGTGISAASIAEHLIACREKRPTSGVTPSFDYSSASAWWGGPFLSWKQFNRFCDNLVAIGLLKDDRSIFVDYASGGTPVESEIQKKRASQAIADVLKANFNPNLHLNETNPDANLFAYVDKTDLIVHSTEFCFLPYGYFAIESTGRVVRPVDTGDAFTASNNELVAEARMSVVVKLFDAYRQTTQKQFYAGTLAARKHLPLTNNNRSLEIGPEPDQGAAPSENEWSGYLALPTVGGLGVNHAKNAVTSTPSGSSEMGEAMHAHFAGDFLLHHHADGVRQELASTTVAGESVANLPDRTETLAGPYSPTMGGGNQYRLARSFRLKPGASFPPLSDRAPLDLRIDGAYSERHSAPAYWLSQSLLGGTTGNMQGVISFWVKGSFFPEMSGKPRMWISMDRYHAGSTSYINPSPFVLLYTATHDAPAYQASTSENGVPFYNLGSPFGPQAFRPMSLGWGYGYSGSSGYGSGSIAEGGVVTPTLNHVAHPDSWKNSLLKGHEWMHVVVTWQPQNANNCKIYINGQDPGATGIWYSSYKPNSSVDWSTHAAPDGSRNSIRFGAVSKYRDTSSWEYNRNWPADATIDEVYMWPNLGATNTAVTQWQEGRYYRVASTQEGFFTSAAIDLLAGSRNLIPSTITAVPPSSTATTSAAATPTLTAATSSVQILGVSWTWFAEALNGQGKELLLDRTGEPLEPSISVSLLAGSSTYGPYTGADFSPAIDAAGQPVFFSGPFKYRVQFSPVPGDAILHATPVFDDITIFYRRGAPEFETWFRS